MLKKTINLNEYLIHGGKLENACLAECYTKKGDKYDFIPIKSIVYSGLNNQNNERLYNVTYVNGDEERYHGMWIGVTVSLVLSSIYL